MALVRMACFCSLVLSKQAKLGQSFALAPPINVVANWTTGKKQSECDVIRCDVEDICDSGPIG